MPYDPYEVNRIINQVGGLLLGAGNLGVNRGQLKLEQKSAPIRNTYIQALTNRLNIEQPLIEEQRKAQRFNTIADIIVNLKKAGINPKDSIPMLKSQFPNEIGGLDPNNLIIDENDIITHVDPNTGIKMSWFKNPDTGSYQGVSSKPDEDISFKQYQEMSPRERNQYSRFKQAGKNQEDTIKKTQAAQIAHNMRTELRQNPYIKDFQDVDNKYSVMLRAHDKSKKENNFVAVDQALITLFNKMTDPTSVVRESEYARTSTDLSLLNKIRGKAQKVMSGGAGLTADERSALTRMAKEFYDAYKINYNQTVEDYGKLAEQSGIDKNLIGIPFAKKEGGQNQKTDYNLSELPDPSQYFGKKAESDNGEVYISDGTTWHKIK